MRRWLAIAGGIFLAAGVVMSLFATRAQQPEILEASLPAGTLGFGLLLSAWITEAIKSRPDWQAVGRRIAWATVAFVTWVVYVTLATPIVASR